MAAWLRDLRYAARALRGKFGFTLAAIVTMAIGIGATTGVFSVVDAVLLRPLPFPDTDRIVALSTRRPDALAPRGVSLEELRDWRQQSRTMTAFCGWRDWGMLRYNGAEREGVYAIVATPELFQVFPAQPVLGRLFDPADDVPGRNQIVLLTERYWRDRFAADPRVIGRPLLLERGPKATYTIVGVLPAAFNEIPSFEDARIFALSSIDPDAETGRAHRNRQVFARLRDEVSLSEARAEVHVIASRLARQYPESNQDTDADVMPIIDYEVGAAAGTLRTFFAAVGFVLLIACTNVAGLQLVRAVGRRREFSLRQALGGSRAALVRVLIAESVLLSFIAGILGLCVAGWLVDLVLASAPAIPRAAALTFDTRVFAFAFVVCMTAGLLGALPASLLTTRLDLVNALKEESGQVVGALRARTAFVAGQVALALILLAGALVAAQTLVRQLTIRPGFDPSELVLLHLFPPIERYRQADDVAGLYARILDEARSVPAVRSASAVSSPPLSGEGAEPVEFTVDGDAAGAKVHTANTFNATAGYFGTLDTPLRRGRDFGAEDSRAAQQVAIVNETFVRRYLAGRDPLRARLRVGPGGDLVQIIGVVGDILQNIRPRAVPDPEIYWPYTQRARWATFLVVRGMNSGQTTAAIRQRIRTLDPEIRVGSPVLMSDRALGSSRGPRFIALLFAIFAGVAMTLSIIGVAGLVFYAFAQRKREIAVRVSLGATRRDVLRLVGGSAFRAVLAGSIAGLLGTLVLGRVLDSALQQLEPLSPRALAAAWTLLVLLGWVACYFPARRALALDPAEALRME